MEDDDPFENCSQETRTYIALHDVMTKMYADNNTECFRLTAQILAKANLPVVIRARCYILLSLRINDRAVTYATAAVELLDKDVRAMVAPDAFPTELFETASILLAEAQARERGPAKAPMTIWSPAPDAGQPNAAPAPTLDEAVSSLPSFTGRHGLVTPGASGTT
ncbi:hypothetical protein NX059_007948 [Plenodomus lindquistii]|nr:hypothetical protein NX059_007948 [Plenodomus lindquistii]